MKAIGWMVSGVVLLLMAIVHYRKKSFIKPPEEATTIYTVTDLGTLGTEAIDPALGNAATCVTAINNVGQVVGTSVSIDGCHAFTWREGVRIDLNHLIPPKSDWQLEKALSINDAGHILGQGRRKGQPRHFLLTPVREAVEA